MDHDRAARKKREKYFCPKFQGQMQLTDGNKHFLATFSNFQIPCLLFLFHAQISNFPMLLRHHSWILNSHHPLIIPNQYSSARNPIRGDFFFLCNISQLTISFSNCYGAFKMWVEGDGEEEKHMGDAIRIKDAYDTFHVWWLVLKF